MSFQQLLHKQQRYLQPFYDNLSIEEAEKALEICSQCQGLLLWSGVGKSGLVAKKIAVTLLSTGTRAFFLPPSDAAHGDLGMVSDQDVSFLLSKSGESDELLELVPYLRNKGAKVVAIVCGEGSRLEKAADVTIHLPFVKELCPFDMAPTVSTTIQMLFGDLLSVALMERKQFTLDQYALNHPAGRIGRRLSLRVQDLMLSGKSMPTCSIKDPLQSVLVELTNKQCGCLCVLNEKNQLEGVFTDGDLRRALQKHGSAVLNQPMASLMTKAPKVIHSQRLATDALRLMEENQKCPISILPVVESSNELVGLVKLHDIIQSGV